MPSAAEYATEGRRSGTVGPGTPDATDRVIRMRRDRRRSGAPERDATVPARPASEQPLLELEVALDRRDGQMLRGHVDRVHAAAAHHRDGTRSRVAYLLGHDALEQLRRRRGHARRDLRQLRIAEETAEHEVVAREPRDRGDERA